MPERDLHEALNELTGNFIPVTEATYWSDTIGEARATAPLLAFNHSRAHILAPHTRGRPVARARPVGGGRRRDRERAGVAAAAPAQDPWRDLPESSPTEPPGGGWG